MIVLTVSPIATSDFSSSLWTTLPKHIIRVGIIVIKQHDSDPITRMDLARYHQNQHLRLKKGIRNTNTRRKSRTRAR